eukprot:CAMPEP_0185763302 /NCGR_PEP_ID=MMETSP1174-20130828/22250_1 /TAXON_ID=35687 /ORGANISM="Dictyocha speculum, Strain CCMP1381" /LENGTH=32 /DNA_ID= /DNA_START= /DNA_END= /DNA_ORIENTATION=
MCSPPAESKTLALCFPKHGTCIASPDAVVMNP